MALIKGSEVVKKLQALKKGDEVVINGDVWLRLSTREFKCSPYGLRGDYDRKATFSDVAEFKFDFPAENTFQFDEVP